MHRPRRARTALLATLIIAASALAAGCITDDSSPGANKSREGPAVRVDAPNGSVAPGTPVTLTARVESAADTVLFQWDFGDGSRQVGENLTTVTHTYTAPGRHAVTLTVTDDRGAQGEGTAQVGVAHTANYRGRVTAGGGGVGGDAYSVAVPVEPDATSLTARVHLAPADGGVSGRVQVRVVAPGNASTAAHAVYEALVDVPAGGVNHTAAVAGDDLQWPGDYRLEVVPREGSVNLDGAVRVAYG